MEIQLQPVEKEEGDEEGESISIAVEETTSHDETDTDGLLAEEGVQLVSVLAALRDGFRCRSCKFLMRPPMHLPATNDCGHTLCMSCSTELANRNHGVCPFPGCGKNIAHAPECNFLIRKAADCYFPDGSPEREDGEAFARRVTAAGDAVEMNDYCCPICCELMVDPTTTSVCGHSACLDCQLQWFDHNQTCPKCRERVPVTACTSVDQLLLELITTLFPKGVCSRRESLAGRPDFARESTVRIERRIRQAGRPRPPSWFSRIVDACKLRFLLYLLAILMFTLFTWMLFSGRDVCAEPVIKEATSQEGTLAFPTNSGMGRFWHGFWASQQCRWVLKCSSGVILRFTSVSQHAPPGSLTVFDGATEDGRELYPVTTVNVATDRDGHHSTEIVRPREVYSTGQELLVVVGPLADDGQTMQDFSASYQVLNTLPSARVAQPSSIASR